MNRIDLIQRLSELDRRGVYVLAKRDIEKLFPNEAEKSLEKSLKRMVNDRLLVRATRGIYVNPAARARSGRIIEDIARVLRTGHQSYVSLESMLSEYGDISKVPVTHMTVMTTGKSGTYETPYGTIEFTHTKRGRADIVSRSIRAPGRPLRIATQKAALEDLRRVGRNLNMLDVNTDDESSENDPPSKRQS